MNMKLPAILAAALSCLSTLAATNGFEVPFFRGLPDTEFSGWETFSVAVGAPGNSPNASFAGGTSTGNGILTQNTAGSFVTGGGNIYSFAGTQTFTLTDTTEFVGGIGGFVFQVATQGTELDYSSVILSYNDPLLGTQNLPGVRTELFNGPVPAGGSLVSSRFDWDLSGLNVNEFSLSFNAAGSSLSLDSVTLDVSAVPEPEEYAAMAAIGLVGLAVWRRTKKQ
jgi:hypothetical protein